MNRCAIPCRCLTQRNRQACEHANPDNDGTLDRKEASKAGIKSKSIFDAANPDNDGTLDLAEYLRALTLRMK